MLLSEWKILNEPFIKPHIKMNGVKFISLVLSMHIINTAGIPVAHDVSLGNIYREVLLTLFFNFFLFVFCFWCLFFFKYKKCNFYSYFKGILKFKILKFSRSLHCLYHENCLKFT